MVSLITMETLGHRALCRITNVASRRLAGGHINGNSHTYKPVEMCIMT